MPWEAKWSSPGRILLDFEQALLDAFRQALPSAQLQGCYFHFLQCLVRKGFRQQFDLDLDVKLPIIFYIKSLFFFFSNRKMRLRLAALILGPEYYPNNIMYP